MPLTALRGCVGPAEFFAVARTAYWLCCFKEANEVWLYACKEEVLLVVKLEAAKKSWPIRYLIKRDTYHYYLHLYCSSLVEKGEISELIEV